MLLFQVKFNNTTDKPELEIIHNTGDESLEVEIFKRFLELADPITATTTSDSNTGKTKTIFAK